MPTLKFSYDFNFQDGEATQYEIEVDRSSFALTKPAVEPLPKWTELDHQKCTHCPLNSSEVKHCPVAANINQVVTTFSSHASTTLVSVRVETEHRGYVKTLPLQNALFSIFGLIMPLTDCPHMIFLRPLARFHLPFANPTETIVRSVSMYLLKQYFVAKKGGTPDFLLQELDSKYKDVQKVNLGISVL